MPSRVLILDRALPVAGLCCAAVVLVLAVGWFSPTPAHTGLSGSTPAAGARLAEAPTQVVLRFTDEISRDFARVSLVRGDAPAQELRAVVRGKQVTAALPASAGASAARTRWVVAYRVVSADGHPISGTVRFSAPGTGPIAATSSSDATAASPESGSDQSDARLAEPTGAEVEDANTFPWGLVIGGVNIGVLVIVAAVLTARAARRRARRA